MARLNAANNVKTELAKSIKANDTQLTVKDASEFPAVPFLLTLDKTQEIIKVTSMNGATLTVERGQENTKAENWDAGTLITMNFTAGMYDALATEEYVGDEVSKIETFSGNYNDLTSKPSIPSKPSDIGLGKVKNEEQASQVDFDSHKADYTKLQINFMDAAIELETMKAADLTGVDANMFVETFQNLDDVTLENGHYDNKNNRLYA